MPRVDDYIEAKRLAVETLSQKPLDGLAEASGFQAEGQGLLIPFLNRTYRVTYPDFDFQDQDDPEKEVPIQEQVLALHYLVGAEKASPAGQWAAYREIPGGTFYWSSFVKRAVDPLKKVFGEALEGFVRTAPMIGGKKGDEGDAAYDFLPYPKVPVKMILHAGDEEFPAEASILFDRSAGDILSPEDLAWLAGMLVYRMIALSYS